MSETRTRIKICGITNLDDARAAIDYGADALGFICVRESPRYVLPETVREIARAVPPFVSKVAVIRDLQDRMACAPELYDTFQYYTNDSGIKRDQGFEGEGRRRLIRAYRISDRNSLDEVEATYREAGAILLDTYHKGKLGGSGETFNWEIAVEAKARFETPLVLAGGLTPDNVEEAIARVRPFAVDISSGVEAEPGRKDLSKLKAFIRAVRRADAPIDRS